LSTEQDKVDAEIGREARKKKDIKTVIRGSWFVTREKERHKDRDP